MRRLGPALVLAALVASVSGCSQTTTPQMTEAALSGPLVLNSAPAGAPAASDASAAPAPVAPVAAPPAASPAPTAPRSTAAATPSPAPSQPTALQSEPTPTTATVAADYEGQFPNINKPPTQPGGTLLPDAARAQIISELEALRNKQAAPGGGGGSAGKPSDLASQASTHGQDAIQQIEACSQEGALENNPDCAPAD